MSSASRMVTLRILTPPPPLAFSSESRVDEGDRELTTRSSGLTSDATRASSSILALAPCKTPAAGPSKGQVPQVTLDEPGKVTSRRRSPSTGCRERR
jgi:hypothetical protein